ncbi:MAG: IS1595 family transposase [Bacteroidetes bacterium]|nr:IS1595 family transposase [Bacteroidota bacterium]
MQLRKFNNLIDLLTFFKDEQVCRDYLELSRWGDQLACPYKDCQSHNIYKYESGKLYKCNKCMRKYSVRVGTMFEDSKVPLSKWFAAIYLITAHKKGVSSLQLQRDLGITQKTAWFLSHRIRKQLGLDLSADKFTGVVEADETFMGGKEGNKHKSKRTKDTQGRSTATKTPVLGVIERGGKVRTRKAIDTSSKSINPFILANVALGSEVKTDEWFGYNRLASVYQHTRVNHSSGEYVIGDTHTNNIEGFWSQLKRSVYGCYHSVSAKHLQQYADESAFRYNTRKHSESGRFDYFLSIATTHITYKQLIQSHDINTTAIKPYREVGTQQSLFGE